VSSPPVTSHALRQLQCAQLCPIHVGIGSCAHGRVHWPSQFYTLRQPPLQNKCSSCHQWETPLGQACLMSLIECALRGCTCGKASAAQVCAGVHDIPMEVEVIMRMINRLLAWICPLCAHRNMSPYNVAKELENHKVLITGSGKWWLWFFIPLGKYTTFKILPMPPELPSPQKPSKTLDNCVRAHALTFKNCGRELVATHLNHGVVWAPWCKQMFWLQY
jgi:hypothetical protein